MRKWNGFVLVALLTVAMFSPDLAEARRVRRGNGAANAIRLNQINRFGLFNRFFFPFFGFGRQFGFFRPVVIPFEGNAINPFSGDILGGGHDFGPQGVPFQNQPQQQSPVVAAPVDNTPRPVGDVAASPARAFSDYNANSLQQILANAVRSVPNAQSTAGEWDGTLCSLSDSYAEKMAAQRFQDGHAGFEAERFPVASRLTGGSAEEITSEGSGSPEAAAQSCVSGWQGSPKHLGSLLNFHKKFCYSMARGANNKYYCVGLFAN